MEKYTDTWTGRWLATGAKTVEDLIVRLEWEIDWLREAAEAGVQVDTGADSGRGMLTLVTDDPRVAEDLGFMPRHRQRKKKDPAVAETCEPKEAAPR